MSHLPQGQMGRFFVLQDENALYILKADIVASA